VAQAIELAHRGLLLRGRPRRLMLLSWIRDSERNSRTIRRVRKTRPGVQGSLDCCAEPPSEQTSRVQRVSLSDGIGEERWTRTRAKPFRLSQTRLHACRGFRAGYPTYHSAPASHRPHLRLLLVHPLRASEVNRHHCSHLFRCRSRHARACEYANRSDG
jgi:hypothetical protein